METTAIRTRTKQEAKSTLLLLIVLALCAFGLTTLYKAHAQSAGIVIASE